MTRKPAYLTPLAEAAVEEMHAYYVEEASEAVASGFLRAVEATTHFLEQYPKTGWLAGRTRDTLQTVRCIPVDRPFGVLKLYYVERDASVEVLAILHASRDLKKILRRIGVLPED